MEAILPHLTDDIVWIGAGNRVLCQDIEGAAAVLLSEKEECPSGFLVTSINYQTQCLSKDICIVYGELHACAQDSGIADLNSRYSFICVDSPSGMKLAHFHASHADADQPDGKHFVRADAGGERLTLKKRMEKADKELKRRSLELETLTNDIPGGVLQCANDRVFTFLSLSSSFLDMTGYTRQEIQSLFQNSFLNMVFPSDQEQVRSETDRQLAYGKEVELEYRLQRKDGKILWIMDRSKAQQSPGCAQSLYCLLLDETHQKKEREALRLSLERHKIIMDQATDIIFEWDILEDALIFSANFKRKFGYQPITERISTGVPLSPNIHGDDMQSFTNLQQSILSGVPYSETELRIRDILGNFIWCRIRATTQYAQSGKPIKAVGVILDIEADKRQRELLEEQAQKDSLTGLFNKTAMRRHVEAMLKKVESGVLFIIDLDDFKQINDRYGHLCGDAVLSDTADVLRGYFRASDLIGRIGGDEFLVFLPDLKSEYAGKKATRLRQALEQIAIESKSGLLACSVGSAAFPQDAKDFFGLYRCADRALYSVKRDGKNGYAAYNAFMLSHAVPDDLLRSSVSAVIDSDSGSVTERLGQYSFRMLYQAVDIKTAVGHILEIVGRAYEVSRVYIFESSEDGRRCSNTFEWCTEGISSQINNLQDLDYEKDLDDYFQNFDMNHVFYCRDIQRLTPRLRDILAQQDVYSLLQCAIIDDGEFLGYVGFDECRENRTWTQEQIDSLTLIANVLSTFLIKLRYKERLFALMGKAFDDRRTEGPKV